ncbi:putative ribonuclease H-like domain-containing protein [Tanacetum coccineum]
MVPRAVLMKSGLVSVNTARQVNVAHSKTIVNDAIPMSYLSKTAHSTVKRPIQKNTTFKNSNFNQRVNTVKDKNVNTTRLKAVVNTARPKAVVNVVQGNNVNVVKALACWVWKPKTKVLDYGNPQMDLQDKGVIDSGCSRHMTGNMSYLTDYEEIDAGYVAFGGNPKGGKITGKATKDETSRILKSFITRIENLVDHKVKVIRYDNRTEFKNREMNQFCEINGILRQYSVARTPQQNGVVERRNRTLIEAARTMLADSKLPTTFLAEAVNTACYTVDPSFSQNPKSSDDDGFKPSSDVENKVNEDPRKESECNDQENEDNVFSTNNVNIVSLTVNVVGINEDNAELPVDPNMLALEDYNIFDISSDDQEDGAEANMNNLDTTIQVSLIPTTRIHKDYHLNQVIGDLQSATQTRNMSKNLEEYRNNLKRNKKDERVIVIINKEIVVAQGYTQEEGIDYDEVFPDRVYKVEKALYGLHQVPKAWYETLSTYLLDNGFQRGKIDKTLFIKRYKGELIFFLGLQVKQKKDGIFISQDKYVGEILKKFGFTEVKTVGTPMETQKPLLKDEDGKEVDVHMCRSMIDLLMYLTYSRPDIMSTKIGSLVSKRLSFDLVAYTDSDYAGESLDRKSTTRGCQFLGCRLISWQCKK